MLGVDYYTCELCGEGTDYGVGDIVYVVSAEGRKLFSYSCCEECVRNFGKLTCCKKRKDATGEYTITKRFVNQMLESLDAEIGQLESKKGKLQEALSNIPPKQKEDLFEKVKQTVAEAVRRIDQVLAAVSHPEPTSDTRSKNRPIGIGVEDLKDIVFIRPEAI